MPRSTDMDESLLYIELVNALKLCWTRL